MIWRAVCRKNFWGNKPQTGIPRDITARALSLMGGPEAAYFYGPRRAGKTTACYQIILALSKRHGAHSCLYVNFEEPAFIGHLEPGLIQDIVERHAQEFKKPPKYVFLDEAQNAPGWEKWVRSEVDAKGIKPIVTGSSAKLLSSEFATTLGGRGLGFLTLPFSFSEYMRAVRGATLSGYLHTGGYPAVVLEKNPERRALLLEEYFEGTISRDIAARYAVRDVSTLRTVAAYVLTNSGKQLSYNGMRSLTGLSFDTIRLYLSYLEDAYLAFQSPHFSYSMKKAMEKPRKYYAYDTGLQEAISRSFSPDLGRRAENAVAIELVRRGFSPQYYSNGFEVDFVVKEGLRPHAMNVCMDEKPPQRETASLSKFSSLHRKASTKLIFGEKGVSDWLLGRAWQPTPK
jgi:predicted AAA+ superfamily ATPase